MNYNVRKANLNDINSIVSIHVERFSSFFLTGLGKPFLQVFYSSFLKDAGVLLVLESEGQIKGFAAGSRSNTGFFKKLLRNNFFKFFIQGVYILFTKPNALKRILANMLHAGKSSLVYAELLSIATLRNKNMYGKILLEEFEKEIDSQNTLNLPITLTTDYENNDKALKFYQDCGYKVLEFFESYDNRKMYRFIKKIN